jgi:hypothetical protein
LASPVAVLLLARLAMPLPAALLSALAASQLLDLLVSQELIRV